MKKEIEEELKKLELELTMTGYHDGWCLKWIKEKIKELKKLKDVDDSILDKDTK